MNVRPTGLPDIRTWPPSLPVVLRPASMSSSVDLPAPEGPTSAQSSPGTTTPESGCRMTFGARVLRSATEQVRSAQASSAGAGARRE